MSIRHLSLLFAVIVGSTVTSTALADEGLHLRVDWSGLAALLREGTPSVLPRESLRSPTQDREAASEQAPWLGLAPRVSLVARDWGSSQVLWGQLSLTDQLRLTRSSRMVVTRVRFANGRIVPFAQVGLGQWRVDTTLLPSLPSDAHTAAQLGGGFELEVAPRASLALEADCTMLDQEGRALDSVAAGHVWMTMLAGRARF
jgi:hypothetical protein